MCMEMNTITFFLFWNWRRIPGITTYESNAPIPNPNKTDARNHSSYVGGTTYQNTGITAMQLKRNNWRQNKTWIFTDNYVLCMGSNIHADSTATIRHLLTNGSAKAKYGLMTINGFSMIIPDISSCRRTLASL